MSWGIVFRASQYFKSSLWIVPFLGAMVGLVFAEVGLRLDAGGVLPLHTYSPRRRRRSSRPQLVRLPR